MLRLRVGNLHTRVVDPEAGTRRWLAGFLTFENDSRAFLARKYGNRDAAAGVDRLYNWAYDTFPTGLLAYVIAEAKANGIPVEHDDADARLVPGYVIDTADVAWLRDYQRDAVDAVLRDKRGILHLPTGAGKTEVFCALARKLWCNHLFIVHRTTLVHNAVERLRKRAPEIAVGTVAEGAWDIPEDARVVCATFQTLAKALKTNDARALNLLNEWTHALHIDECHTLPADTFYNVAMSTPNAYWRVGYSGTPLARGDKRSTLAVAALGGVIHRVRPEQLIAAGVLAKPRIRVVPVTQTSDALTWQGVYSECVMRSATRNAAVVDCVRKAEKPCLVFVSQIDHGEALQQRLAKANISAEFVSGAESVEQRAAAVRRLERGDADVLIASVVFQEGVDIPTLASVVMAAGGKSTIAAIQKVGRALRVAPGKTEAEVWEFDDRGHRLLERHTKARLRAYAAEGYPTTIEGNAATASRKVRKATGPCDKGRRP